MDKLICNNLFENFIFNSLENMTSPIEAGQFGFHFQYMHNKFPEQFSVYVQDFILEKGDSNIQSITREGQVDICDKNNQYLFTDGPENIFHNQDLMNKFHTTQAFYIGYLTGRAFNKKININPKTLDITQTH